jgi:DNA-binding LacI/PurR family transcriptional regulator
MSRTLESDQDVRIVAATANVDVRTLRRVLDGNMPRSRATRDAIAAALKQHRFFDQAKQISGGES